MKITYDGKKWYTLQDLAAAVFIPYATIYTMVRKLRTIAPPTHKIPGGQRDYYDEADMVSLAKHFTKYRNAKSAARLAKVAQHQAEN